MPKVLYENYPFKVGVTYRRRDVYRIIGIPEDTRGGNWETGYNRHGDDWFLFCNVGVAGNSGHDYPNEFVGDDLRWFGKTTARLSHPSIQSMLSDKGLVYVFTRTHSKASFVFSGIARALEQKDTVPVEILWTFDCSMGTLRRAEVSPEEVLQHGEIFEGATKRVSVNIYERNPVARRLCLAHYGTACSVCKLRMDEIYGSLAGDFIHVHHLKPIHEVGENYEVDPIHDLRPVCPNCHSMLHRREPPLSIDELSTIVQRFKSPDPTL